MGKHEKTEHYTTHIDETDYYRRRINNLQKELDDVKTKYELALSYIEALEREKLSMTAEIGKLERAVIREVTR